MVQLHRRVFHTLFPSNNFIAQGNRNDRRCLQSWSYRSTGPVIGSSPSFHTKLWTAFPAYLPSRLLSASESSDPAGLTVTQGLCPSLSQSFQISLMAAKEGRRKLRKQEVKSRSALKQYTRLRSGRNAQKKYTRKHNWLAS